MKVWQTDKQIKKIIPKNKFFFIRNFRSVFKKSTIFTYASKKKNGNIQKQQGI